MLEALPQEDLDAFFSYIDAHLRENGVDGAPLFQPQAREQNGFPAEKRASFRAGLGLAVGAREWRRAWVWRDGSGRIAGHIDLRGRPEPFTAHRALLGMGLAPALRGKGIGLEMIRQVLRWARDTGVIEYVDLDVLAGNEPALRLYRKAGFEIVGRLDDMFRIDGGTASQVWMTRKL